MTNETETISQAIEIMSSEFNKLFFTMKNLQVAVFIGKEDEITDHVSVDILAGLEKHFKRVKFSPDEIALDPMLKVYKSKTNRMIIVDLINEQSDIISSMEASEAVEYLIDELLTRLTINNYGPDYLNK